MVMHSKETLNNSGQARPRRSLLVDAAVAACLLATRVASADQAAAPTAAAADEGDELTEVVVTAQRRTENMQDVPITIQAMTSETLQQLHIDNFDDMVKYLPNVSQGSFGPGQSTVYMRGLSTGVGGAIQGSGSVGVFPNVAVYLDDQSAQLPDRNLDIYAADLERVEVLEGPQGTLFGAGAEAGVVRYITNKPNLTNTEVHVNTGYALTTGGDPSSNVDVTFNLPLIDNKLAVRAVIYNDSRGGYINNIPATFARSSSDIFITNYENTHDTVPAGSIVANNYALAENASNPVTYKGARLEGLYQINDDWNVLLTESVQNMDAEGVSWEEAYDGLGKALPDLSVELFSPSYDKDKFEDTALTVNGRIGDLRLVYSGGYLVRQIDQAGDYTNYTRGLYAGYYQCIRGNSTATPYCYSPVSPWTDVEKSTHQSHELRLSTPDDWRWRALGGLYWENFTVHDDTTWLYATDPNVTPIAPAPGSTNYFDEGAQPGAAYIDAITRGYKQTAAFFSTDYDLIPKQLTLTLGTRYYDTQNFEEGSSVSAFSCSSNGGAGPAATNPCEVGANNLNARPLQKSYVGFKSRANLAYHVTDDAMIYYTWSQGFRPGGFDRKTVTKDGFTQPLSYAPDALINNELGWKTQWLDHRVELNGAVYQENWQHTQLEIFDPPLFGVTSFVTNGPSYQVRGLELSTVARITHGLTANGSAAWNSSKSTSTLDLVGGNGTVFSGKTSPFGPLGSPLANSPPFQANLHLRYEFPLGSYDGFVQAGEQHVGGSYSTTNQAATTLQGLPQRFYDPAYSTTDAALGASKDAWTFQLYGENLTNERGITSASYAQYVKMDSIIRPRTMGLRFSYNFKGQ